MTERDRGYRNQLGSCLNLRNSNAHMEFHLVYMQRYRPENSPNDEKVNEVIGTTFVSLQA